MHAGLFLISPMGLMRRSRLSWKLEYAVDLWSYYCKILCLSLDAMTLAFCCMFICFYDTPFVLCFIVSSHPSPSVLIPALRTVGNIVTGDDAQTQVQSCLSWIFLITSHFSLADMRVVFCSL